MKKLSSLLLLAASVSSLAMQSSSDPFFAKQWSLHNDGSQAVPISIDDLDTNLQLGKVGVDIGYNEGSQQALAHEKNPVTVAVIDYGIDPTHPDLQGRISADGFDFLTNTNKMTDDEGHGTHVSGIIAANTGNDIGISGITGPMVKILPLRILNKDFSNFVYNKKLISDYAADAIRYAIQKKASVINMSLGWPKLVDSDNAKKAVQEALAAGIVVVAAAGNDLKQQPTYPCAYSGVICVGAITNTGALSLYSNWGGKVDVVAPGDYILSTYAENVESQLLRVPGYEALSGTSQAAPMISAMAAILKSSNPQMSPKEVLARITAASLPPPQYSGMPAAQYGLPRLPGLFAELTHPVYQADFKALEDILVDESTLKASGVLTLNKLFGTAAAVNATIQINGQNAGTASIANIAAEGSVQIPWTYQFASLDDSADLKFTVSLSDSQGVQKQFVANLVASRQPLQMATTKQLVVAANTAQAGDWMGRNILGRLAGKMGAVSIYGQSSGYPEYYRVKASDDKGVTVEILSPADTTPVRAVTIPAVKNLSQVVHFRSHQAGDFEWLFTAVVNVDKATYFQFYYLDHDLKPFSSAPLRRIPATLTMLDQLIPRSYSAPGSWIRNSNGELAPCFLDVGLLPTTDNFDQFDPRSKQVSQHFYYFEKDPTAKAVAGQQTLRLRALDSKAWALKYPNLSMIQSLPQTASEILSGSRKFLWGSLTDLTIPVQMLTVKSIGQASFSNTNWTRLDTFGDRAVVTPGDMGADQMAYGAYTDAQHGSLAWTDGSGQFLGRSQFVYQNVGDPFVGKILGANKISGQGYFWFLQSHDNLVGYLQTQDGKITEAKMPLDRDSSFATDIFGLMFAPELVGDSSHPRPGIFVDSSQIVGSRVNVVTFNFQKKQLERSLRYSLSIPPQCLNMVPVHLQSAANSFAIPLICLPANKDQAFQVNIVQP